jgi:Fe-S-cluster-containing dehydrogenase component
MSKYMIRHDPQRCISCKACEVHCQVKNRTAAGVKPGALITVGPARLPDKVQVTSAFRPCFHCEKPWCVAVCPTGAMVKREQDGLVHVVRTCVGCRACVGACPWKVPQWMSPR